MRTLIRSAIVTAIALMLGSPAAAAVSVSLTQIGGSYSAASGVSAGDTLVLQIDYAIDGGTLVSLIDPALDIGNLATLVSGTETGAAEWEIGGVIAAPIGTGDIRAVSPGQLDGWEKAAFSPWGTPGSCLSDTSPGGSCGTLGTVTLSLTGLPGVIDTGSIVPPARFATVIADGTFTDITSTSNLGTFTIVPEPTPASLLGLGLLGIAAARRPRA